MKRLIAGSFLVVMFASSALASPDPAAGAHSLMVDPLNVAGGTIATKEWDNLWRIYPAALREQIAAHPELKAQIMNERYGFNPRPDASSIYPLGWNRQGAKLIPSCLMCHSGQVPTATGFETVVGAPNTRVDLQTFFEDRIALYRSPDRDLMDLSFQDKATFNVFINELSQNPVNVSRGTANVWRSGALYLGLRTKGMSVSIPNTLRFLIGKPVDFGVTSADMDVPPWWNTVYRDRLFIDGFVPKQSRMLSLILMPSGNDVKALDPTYENILSYIQTVSVPAYPLTIDSQKAARGQVAFEQSCAQCHGTYREDHSLNYPGVTIPLRKLGTDSERLEHGMTPAYRTFALNSWVGNSGSADIRTAPNGYVAPPLRGVWASAPYLHNGSVPTLRGVLFPEERPAVWKADFSRYDFDNVGLSFTSHDSIPHGITAEENRRYFNTHRIGKSNEGHRFPERLTVEERLDVLEYLKTL